MRKESTRLESTSDSTLAARLLEPSWKPRGSLLASVTRELTELTHEQHVFSYHQSKVTRSQDYFERQWCKSPPDSHCRTKTVEQKETDELIKSETDWWIGIATQLYPVSPQFNPSLGFTSLLSCRVHSTQTLTLR